MQNDTSIKSLKLVSADSCHNIGNCYIGSLRVANLVSKLDLSLFPRYALFCLVLHSDTEDPLEIWSFHRGNHISEEYGRRVTVFKPLGADPQSYFISFGCHCILTGHVPRNSVKLSLIRYYIEGNTRRAGDPLDYPSSESAGTKKCCQPEAPAWYPWSTGYDSGIETIGYGILDCGAADKQAISIVLNVPPGLSQADVTLEVSFDTISYVHDGIVNSAASMCENHIRSENKLIRQLMLCPPAVRSCVVHPIELQFILPGNFENIDSSSAVITVLPMGTAHYLCGLTDRERFKQSLVSYVSTAPERTITGLGIRQLDGNELVKDTSSLTLLNQLSLTEFQKYCPKVYSLVLPSSRDLVLNFDPRESNLYIILCFFCELSNGEFLTYWSKIVLSQVIRRDGSFAFSAPFGSAMRFRLFQKSKNFQHEIVGDITGHFKFRFVTIPNRGMLSETKIDIQGSELQRLFGIGTDPDPIELTVKYRSLQEIRSGHPKTLAPEFICNPRSRALPRIIFTDSSKLRCSLPYKLKQQTTANDYLLSLQREELHRSRICLSREAPGKKIPEAGICQSRPNSQHTFAYGDGLYKATVAHEALFTISLRDIDNQPANSSVVKITLRFVLVSSLGNAWLRESDKERVSGDSDIVNTGETTRANETSIDKYSSERMPEDVLPCRGDFVKDSTVSKGLCVWKNKIRSVNGEQRSIATELDSRRIVSVRYTVREHDNGIIRVIYSPLLCGHYKLHTLLGGLDIAGSPSDLFVTSPPADPNACTVEGNSYSLASLDEYSSKLIGEAIQLWHQDLDNAGHDQFNSSLQIFQRFKSWYQSLKDVKVNLFTPIIRDALGVEIHYNIWVHNHVELQYSPNIEILYDGASEPKPCTEVDYVVAPGEIRFWVPMSLTGLGYLQTGIPETPMEKSIHLDMKINGSSISNCPMILKIENADELSKFYRASVLLLLPYMRELTNGTAYHGGVDPRILEELEQAQAHIELAKSKYNEIGADGFDSVAIAEVWNSFHNFRTLLQDHSTKLLTSAMWNDVKLYALADAKLPPMVSSEIANLRKEEMELKYKISTLTWQVDEKCLHALDILQNTLNNVSEMKCIKVLDVCHRIQQKNSYTVEQLVLLYNELYEELKRLSRPYLGPLIAGELFAFLEDQELSRYDAALKWRETRLQEREQQHQQLIDSLNLVWDSLIESISQAVYDELINDNKSMTLDSPIYQEKLEEERLRNRAIKDTVQKAWNYEEASSPSQVESHVDVAKTLQIRSKSLPTKRLQGEPLAIGVQATPYENSVILSSRVTDLSIRRRILAETSPIYDKDMVICNNLILAIRKFPYDPLQKQSLDLFKQLHKLHEAIQVIYEHYRHDSAGINLRKYREFLVDIQLPEGFTCDAGYDLLMHVFEIYAVTPQSKAIKDYRVSESKWFQLLARLSWYYTLYTKLLLSRECTITEKKVTVSVDYVMPSMAKCNFLFMDSCILPLLEQVVYPRNHQFRRAVRREMISLLNLDGDENSEPLKEVNWT